MGHHHSTNNKMQESVGENIHNQLQAGVTVNNSDGGQNNVHAFDTGQNVKIYNNLMNLQ